jgi:hypothetical protein
VLLPDSVPRLADSVVIVVLPFSDLIQLTRCPKPLLARQPCSTPENPGKVYQERKIQSPGSGSGRVPGDARKRVFEFAAQALREVRLAERDPEFGNGRIRLSLGGESMREIVARGSVSGLGVEKAAKQ